jgi:hypothetical protein
MSVNPATGNIKQEDCDLGPAQVTSKILSPKISRTKKGGGFYYVTIQEPDSIISER